MNYTEHFEATIEHVRQELSAIRTSRANPALVENIPVNAYGGTLPIVQLASISIQDNRTLTIQPWDKSVLKDIERALQQSDLGMMPVNDGNVLRLTNPQLTEERRKEYLKVLGQKLEAGRVAIRKVREDQLNGLRTAKQDGTIGEDEFTREQKELQKTVDEATGKIDDLGRKKEQELLTV